MGPTYEYWDNVKWEYFFKKGNKSLNLYSSPVKKSPVCIPSFDRNQKANKQYSIVFCRNEELSLETEWMITP